MKRKTRGEKEGTKNRNGKKVEERVIGKRVKGKPCKKGEKRKTK